MRTVELLEQTLSIAEKMGYQIRHEYLGGSGGGACEFGGKKWLFIDLALNAVEQLDQAVEAVRHDPQIHLIELPPSLNRVMGPRRAA